jgi:hypothetical protein
MKRLRTRAGERIWLETHEIEAITDGALRSAGLFPGEPAGPVAIEAFLEVHLGAHVDYGEDLPSSILGYTQFGSPPRVVVNRALTDLALAPQAPLGLRGRWRATLAHEAGHILLHEGLGMPFDRTPSLSSEAVSGSPALGESDWREVQANMAMAALLMPRGPFLVAARRALERSRVFLPLGFDALATERLVTILAHQLETSGEATRWRLRNLGWVSAPRDVQEGPALRPGFLKGE